MTEYVDEADETLSLSDLQIHDDTTSSEDVNQTFYQDFFGFCSEEWSPNTSYHTSPENIIFCGKLLVSSQDNLRKPTAKVDETNPLYRSTSGSFRHMRFKIATERSRLMASKSKSRWHVFMFGFGSGKFPTKMDLSDIKCRQLRRQTPTQSADHVGREESGGQRPEKKGWWRLVDVLGCGGGYERDMVAVF